MNYLAHLYLAGAEPESLIGNLMGDFTKGLVDQHLSPGIRQGIEMHRKIDAFTDSHPCFLRSKQRIYPQFRRYAGILVDIFYDHFLARNWALYSCVSLRYFSGSVYRILLTYYQTLPAPMQRSVSYMIANDLLQSYREISGISRALQGIESRLKRPSRLGEGVAELTRNYESLKADFVAFFPELILHVTRQRVAASASVKSR